MGMLLYTGLSAKEKAAFVSLQQIAAYSIKYVSGMISPQSVHTKDWGDTMTFQDEFPIGFTMSLAQHTDVLTQFASLSPEEQQRIVDGSRQMKSRREMQNYVENMFQG